MSISASPFMFWARVYKSAAKTCESMGNKPSPMTPVFLGSASCLAEVAKAFEVADFPFAATQMLMSNKFG